MKLAEVVMCSLRPLAIIAAFLIISVSIPQSQFSQTAPKPAQPKQPAPRQRQPERPQRADALAPAINELLGLDPLAPESPDQKDSEKSASEDEDKPPADDAPIKELIAYWSERDGSGVNDPKPSDKVRRRLLEAFEDRPDLLSGLADLFPEGVETHDSLYRLLNEETDDENEWKSYVQTWLRRNSAYFRDELIKSARAVDDHDDSIEDLRALARLDWDAAKPILETFASAGKPQVTPVALSLLYKHAMQNGDSARAESYRAHLKAIVANRRANYAARREAVSSLTSDEWSGQEEWFVSLFSDPTLSGLREESGAAAESEQAANVKSDGAVELATAPGHDGIAFVSPRAAVLSDKNLELSQNSILATALESDVGRRLPVVSALVGHNQRAVHNAAVKCLVEFLAGQSGAEGKEAARILSPWLTDPNWARQEDRLGFISNLTDLKAPELIPGLIWVLEHDGAPDIRVAAAEALTQYRDPRAVPALRRALENDEYEENREKIVTALAECGGFSDDEMAAAIEAYARVVVTEKGEQEIDRARYGGSDEPLPLKVSVGRILHESETIQATEGLAIRLLERAKALRAKQPAVARQILRTIEGAPLRVTEINLVERIGEGWADVDSITLALETRDTLGKSASDELYGLIKQGGYAAGVAAAILNDEREWKAALENGDAKFQLALLACARYLRDKLPVELAGKLLNSPNRALAKAAEGYLEVEDSAEARKLVLARHAGEAYILGDLTAISGADDYIESVRSWEDALRKETQGQNGLEAIYAVLQMYSAENLTGVIIRVRGGKAEMSVYETEGRRNVRWLTGGEFEELKSFASRREIEDLGPETYAGEDERGRLGYEYLRLTKDGGRRIVLDALRRAPKNPTPHEELSGLFYRLSRSGEFTARYKIEDKIAGVEVIFADSRQSALMVCGEGREVRVLVAEKGVEYRQNAAGAKPEWRVTSSGKVGAGAGEPSACRGAHTPAMRGIAPAGPNGYSIPPARLGDARIYASYGRDPGVWKAEPDAEPVKIINGPYVSPVVTPDGKWLVAAKADNEEGRFIPQLIRHNLQTGKESVIKMRDNGYSLPFAYVAAHRKVLVEQSGFNMTERSFLLDPETEAVQPVKGEFRPLVSAFHRALQPTGNPNEFWAVIHDSQKMATSFGRYDSKNFSFTPLIELPELRLTSDDIWVDTAGGKIWITYQSHLLRLPMPAQARESRR